jgi:hypothetical protein
MKPLGIFQLISQWIAVTSITVGASIFWGAIVAGIARISFGIEPGRVLLVVGLPVALMVAAFLFPRMWGILGYR